MVCVMAQFLLKKKGQFFRGLNNNDTGNFSWISEIFLLQVQIEIIGAF